MSTSSGGAFQVVKIVFLRLRFIFLFVAICMTVIGATLEPRTAALAAITVAVGALFFRFFLRKS